MTNLERLAVRRDDAYREYDELEVKSRSGFGISMADLICASNKAGSAFMAWHSELDGVKHEH